MTRWFLPCILTQFKPQTLAVDTAGGVDTFGGVDIVPTPPTVAPTIPIGADTYGGVDTLGFVDAPAPAIQAPTVYSPVQGMVAFTRDGRWLQLSNFRPNTAPLRLGS